MSRSYRTQDDLLREQTVQALLKAAAALTNPMNPPEPIIAWTALALYNLAKLYPNKCDSTCEYVWSQRDAG